MKKPNAIDMINSSAMQFLFRKVMPKCKNIPKNISTIEMKPVDLSSSELQVWESEVFKSFLLLWTLIEAAICAHLLNKKTPNPSARHIKACWGIREAIQRCLKETPLNCSVQRTQGAREPQNRLSRADVLPSPFLPPSLPPHCCFTACKLRSRNFLSAVRFVLLCADE